MSHRIKLRRDRKSFWESGDPILAAGEIAYLQASKELKVGDGITPFSQLPKYINEEIHYLVKEADQEMILNAVLTPDAELTSPILSANSIYRVEIQLMTSGRSTGGFRFQVQRSGLSDAEFNYAGDLDNNGAITLDFGSTISINISSTRRLGYFVGLLHVKSDPGSLILSWSQTTASDVSPLTTLHAGSNMILRKIN
ncbi:hyaluronate lyase N-terminal domain-containing protein [Algoriphagus marincola]|uniref:hyaluronate lyase N-terminal domain-containing protein n=1 Tax=Algoriphagus marincola TaxID=264027 RepID=UPI000413217F|nr:hypothetical protein [Algoriphagus marincola]